MTGSNPAGPARLARAACARDLPARAREAAAARSTGVSAPLHEQMLRRGAGAGIKRADSFAGGEQMHRAA
jgi:hypothetical protein